MAAVTATVAIFASAPFRGTCRRTAPPPRLIWRAPSLKLKIVFAPRRVIVKSRKVSSERESAPVRTAVPASTLSFTTAARAAACPGSNLTSLII